MKLTILRAMSLIWFAALLANCDMAQAESPVEAWASTVPIPAEMPEAAVARHARVRARRQQVVVICHRGAVEFARENTLEAYRATFELGADGNEIDIRATKDGVLVCFHDDMLDNLLHAYGDTPDYTYDELRAFRFRETGKFGEYCRIPTLVEVFELHRKYGGLIQLDIKRPGLDGAIATLLDRMDLWDHVVVSPGDRIRRNERFAPLRYKAALYEDHSDLFPDQISAALAKPGEMVMVEDPRAILLALGRQRGKLSDFPVAPAQGNKPSLPLNIEMSKRNELIATLRDAGDWNQTEGDQKRQALRAARIVDRARAADALAALGQGDEEILSLLEERVRNRSLNAEWQYHGLDGAAALRALFTLEAGRAVPLARFILFRDDPELARVKNPMYDNPRAWTDFRQKFVVFDCLKTHPLPGAAELCREYLRLEEADARQIGIPQFDQAADALLTLQREKPTALELLRHSRRDVRGRAILHCLRFIDQPWAVEALTEAAPHTLKYRMEQ